MINDGMYIGKNFTTDKCTIQCSLNLPLSFVCSEPVAITFLSTSFLSVFPPYFQSAIEYCIDPGT